jgi:hypothetical protein
MGHRINVWVQRLLLPAFVMATLVLMHEFRVFKTLVILLPIFAALMLILMIADPGPRTQAFLDSVKNRTRR